MDNQTKPTLQGLLEKDREKLIRDLEEAGTGSRALPVLEEATGKLLYQYNASCESEDKMKTAAELMRVLRPALSLADTAGEILDEGEAETPGKKKILRLLRCAVPGALMLAGAVLLSHEAVSSGAPAVLSVMGILLAACGGIFLFAAGVEAAGGPGKGKKKALQIKADPDRIYRSLYAVLVSMDRELEEKAGSGKIPSPLPAADDGSVSLELTELCSELLEAQACEDGELALERLSQVRYFLHRRGIEAVDYTPENSRWFEVLASPSEPASAPFTVRPALVKGTELLRKGTAILPGTQERERR